MPKQKSLIEMNGPPWVLTTDRDRKSGVRAEEGAGPKSVQTEAGVLLDSPASVLNKTCAGGQRDGLDSPPWHCWRCE